MRCVVASAAAIEGHSSQSVVVVASSSSSSSRPPKLKLCGRLKMCRFSSSSSRRRRRCEALRNAPPRIEGEDDDEEDKDKEEVDDDLDATRSTNKTTKTIKRRRRDIVLALQSSSMLFTKKSFARNGEEEDVYSISSNNSITNNNTYYKYEINARKRLLETQRLYALQPEVDERSNNDVDDTNNNNSNNSNSNESVIEIPMTYDGASFVLDYYIGDASVRGVVDTGSPFITIQGGNGSENWGFVTQNDIRPSPYGETYEVYGLQVDSSTVWCLGDLRFTTGLNDDSRSRSRDWNLREMVLGVVNGSMANVGGSINGANASFVGLTKYRQDWIRPTFLEQTDVSSFSMNFEKETLTLSRKNLIDRRNDANVLAMIDLRPLGSPVYHYAVLLDDLYINGEKHKFKNKNEKTYVIFDSGTTGLLVSQDLYENSAFRDGAFQAAMTFTDVKGNKSSVAIGSSIRTCTRKCLFLCLPLKVPWDGVLEEKSNVIFAGLAVLMNQGEITVDADEGVLRLKSDPGVSRMEFEADEEGFIPIRTRGKLASDIKLYNET
jgi:hypothetical protein